MGAISNFIGHVTGSNLSKAEGAVDLFEAAHGAGIMASKSEHINKIVNDGKSVPYKKLVNAVDAAHTSKLNARAGTAAAAAAGIVGGGVAIGLNSRGKEKTAMSIESEALSKVAASIGAVQKLVGNAAVNPRIAGAAVGAVVGGAVGGAADGGQGALLGASAGAGTGIVVGPAAKKLIMNNLSKSNRTFVDDGIRAVQKENKGAAPLTKSKPKAKNVAEPATKPLAQEAPVTTSAPAPVLNTAAPVPAGAVNAGGAKKDLVNKGANVAAPAAPAPLRQQPNRTNTVGWQYE